MKRRLIGSLAGLALAAGAMVATVAPASGGPLGAEFTTPGPGTIYVVPPDICQLDISAVGAEGGDGGAGILNGILGAAGEQGASAEHLLTVSPGDVLQVNVGGGGGDASLINLDGGDAGINGGGAGGDGLIVAGGGGGGGGASDVRTGGFTPAERVVVAGGGGGGGAGLLNVLLGGDGGFGGQFGEDGDDVLLGGQGGQSGGGGGTGGASGLLLGGDAGDDSDVNGLGGAGGNGTVILEPLIEVIFGGGGGGGGLIGGGGGGSGSALGLGGGGGGGGLSLGTAFADSVDGNNDDHGRVTIVPVAGSCDGEPTEPCERPLPAIFQPDATRETPRLGDDIYDDGSPEFQTQFEQDAPRFGSTLDVYIQNDGNVDDSFVLTGPASPPGFLVRYQHLIAADGSHPKNYITEQVTGAGFTTGVLPACGEMKVRIHVKVSVSTPPGSTVDIPLKVTSNGNSEVSDTARLFITVVAP